MGELNTTVTAISNLKQMKVIIRAELESLVDGFISLGYYLKKTRDTEMYKEDGYENIFEFAKAEFNLGRSSVYSYMAINDRFSIDGNSPELADEFRGYGSTKLGEMLTLTDEQMQDITPDATRNDIRDYKKIMNENNSPAGWTNGLNTQSEPDFSTQKNSLYEFVNDYFKNEGRNVFEKAITIVLSAAGDREERIMYSIAPSKFKMIRVPGGITVICNADSITVMKPGQAKEIYNYTDLIEIIERIFQASPNESAADIFKKYYQEDLVPVKVEVKITEHQETKEVKKEVAGEKPKQKTPEKVADTQSDEDTDDTEEEDREPEENSNDKNEDDLPDQMEDEPEYLLETKVVEGEVIQETFEEAEDSDYNSNILPEIKDYNEDATPIQEDKVLVLANKLQKVMDAKKEYLKLEQEYRKLAAENGVTDECINYILSGGSRG